MMSFWKAVKRGMRTEGVWLDAKQARALLALAERGSDPDFLSFLATSEEVRLLRRLRERCLELKAE